MSTAERVHSWPKVVAAFEGWVAMLQAFEAEVREAEPGIVGIERDRS